MLNKIQKLNLIFSDLQKEMEELELELKELKKELTELELELKEIIEEKELIKSRMERRKNGN